MKRLLILGGSRYILPVIDAAHKLGCYVITCDYLPDNIAHKYSDEYKNVSIIDKEAVLEAAKELKIDGIMSFACDPGVATAAYVAEKLGLPNCGPYESVSILQNKGKFRKFLTDNGFTVPTAKGYDNISDALNDVSAFHWPVIVKPADSAGSKGVTKVEKPEDLKESIEYALAFSHCDQFIIEDFIEKKGCSSDSDCFSVDGELKFVSFSDQLFDEKAENPYTPAAYCWPSSLPEKHQKELASEIGRLLKLLGMRTSIYNVETREGTDGKAYIMEVSPRGGGNRIAEILEYATGIDLIPNCVRAALGMPVVGMEQKTFRDYFANVVIHSDKPGIFEKVEISDEIKNEVYEQVLWTDPGTKIGGFSAANEAIGSLVIKCETKERMLDIIKNNDKYVKVIVK